MHLNLSIMNSVGSCDPRYLCMFYFLCIFMVKELECERECSRGEDYRLIKLTITDFNVVTATFVLFIISCQSYTSLGICFL